MKKVVVLLSGGLDSVTALYDAKQQYDVMAGISFDYHSKHNYKELPEAEYHCKKLSILHQIIELGFIGDLYKSDLLKSGGSIPDGHYEEPSMKATVVPFRNGIMLAVATGLAESCGADALVIAAHAGDHAIYPDCRETFMKAMADAMKFGTYAEVELLRPFISMTKAEIVSRGSSLQVDFSHTWSCYKGGEIHCGTCGTCMERREAFLLAGIDDPTIYQNTSLLPPRPVAC